MGEKILLKVSFFFRNFTSKQVKITQNKLITRNIHSGQGANTLASVKIPRVLSGPIHGVAGLFSIPKPFASDQINAESQKTILAHFTNVTEEKIASFKDSTLMVTVSVSNQPLERSYLAAKLALINQSHFQACKFVIGDSLQRITLALTNMESKESLYLKSIEMGDKWIDENSKLLKKLQIPYTIMRWDYFVQHPNFQKFLAIVKDTYKAETKYRDALEASIQDYLERLSKRGVNLVVSHEEAHKICLEYIQEECAAMYIWAKQGCRYELYASGKGHSPALQATRSIIETLYDDVLCPLTLRFRGVANSVENDKKEKNLDFIGETVNAKTMG